MSESFGRFPREIQEQRDRLANEIRGIRTQRNEAREKADSWVSRIFIVPHFLYSREATRHQEESEETLAKGKRAIEQATAMYGRFREGQKRGGNTISEQKLLQECLERMGDGSEVHPVATDSFIQKSKDEYNAAWLAREIVQNFVDHNPLEPGTLNGVEIFEEPIGDEGLVRFTIRGQWPYEDPTGVLSPHSDKPADTETAGGNGIGLKQTALRYLRDFGVSRFQIQGEGWAANYALVRARDVNRALSREEDAGGRTIKHDWLVARLEPSEERGSCTYIIETDNQQVKAALGTLNELGVSAENPFLQDPDFENDHGSIKWILPAEGTRKPASEGRLYVNGQVMNVGSKGKTAEDYWRGPDFVTVRLNNTRYKMSIDRPPLRPHEFFELIGSLVESMTDDEIIEQLRVAMPIWTTRSLEELRQRYSESGGTKMLERLVHQLRWSSDFSKDGASFAESFPEGGLLAYDAEITPKQFSELTEKGYRICPHYFAEIGMPKVSGRLNSFETAMSGEVDTYHVRNETKKLAESSGIAVAFEDIKVQDGEGLMRLLADRLSLTPDRLTIDDRDPLTIRVSLTEAIDATALSAILSRPKDEGQRQLHFLRGFVRAGMSDGIIARAALAQGEFVCKFAVGYDGTGGEDLFVKNIPAASDDGAFLEFTLRESAAALKDSLDELSHLSREDRVLRKTTKGVRIPLPAQNELAPPDEASLRVLETVVPGITDLMAQLDSLPSPKRRKGVVEMFDEARDEIVRPSDAVDYLSGDTVFDVIERYTKAHVLPTQKRHSSATSQLEALQVRMQEAINAINPDEAVQNFEIVTVPTEQQLNQLGLLRMYFYIATGVNVENQLFIFRGQGAYGINLGQRAIGLHEEMFSGGFMEAVRIFSHESAHNAAMDHELGFRTANESLLVAGQERLLSIARRLADGETIDPREQAVLDIGKTWETLKPKRQRISEIEEWE